MLRASQALPAFVSKKKPAKAQSVAPDLPKII
jgi:hypothetical protein